MALSDLPLGCVRYYFFWLVSGPDWYLGLGSNQYIIISTYVPRYIQYRAPAPAHNLGTNTFWRLEMSLPQNTPEAQLKDVQIG